MAIRRNPQGKWMVDIAYKYPDGTPHPRIRKVVPVQTRRAAQQYEREILNALSDGTYEKEERKRLKVEEFYTDFLEVYAKNNNKNSVLITKRGVLENHLLPVFGKMYLDEITPLHVERYKAKKLGQKLKKKRDKNDGDATYSKKTINNHLGVLSKMLNLAVDWGFLEYCIKIPRFTNVQLPEVDFLDFAELDRLVAQATGQHGRAIALAAKTGMRIGELRGLHWDDVDLVAKRMTIKRSIVHRKVGTPKNGKSRELPLCDTAVAILKRQKHLKGDYVFSEDDGRPLEINTMYRRLKFFCKKAGLRKIGFHTLRHTFASHLVMKGVPLKVTQELLGHSDIKMTLRYAHLSPDVKHDFIRRLDIPWHCEGISDGDSAELTDRPVGLSVVPNSVSD